ncbi:MAG TPA: hypothetical protein VFS29_07400 [Motilibacteraceae bacterium]|nr:hypothetical protein [Motilibacteraceae bacterium]
MLLYVVLAVIALAVIVLLARAVVRHDRTDETERFHHARQLTTEWSTGVEPGRPRRPAAPERAEDRPNEAREPGAA